MVKTFKIKLSSLKRKRGGFFFFFKSIANIWYVNAKALKVYVVFQRDKGKTTYCTVYF